MDTDKRPKHSNYTRGGQITFHNLRMFFQINTALFKWISVSVLGATVLLTYVRAPANTFMAVWYSIRNHALLKLKTLHQHIRLTIKQQHLTRFKRAVLVSTSSQFFDKQSAWIWSHFHCDDLL